MRIKRADIASLVIPFSDFGGEGAGLMPSKWDSLSFVLLRLEADDGTVGWGDAFAYTCQSATAAALRDMVLPHVVGAEIEDIAAFNTSLQKTLHIFGRFGVSIFAISAVDIALWDIAAKRAGAPLADLLGRKRDSFPAYASLVRYGDPAQVERIAARAVDEGYSAVKLHEITAPTIEAGRRGAPDARLMTDVNCNWSDEEARRLLTLSRDLGLFWVEEPIFPPEDDEALGRLRAEFGVPLAAGENACTASGFRRLVEAVDFPQPSVTKVGGVSEYLGVLALAEAAGKEVMPHCPYFGPGYWASAQLMAASTGGMFERLYITPEALPSGEVPEPVGGRITLPDRPGTGFEPDEAVLSRYAVSV